MSPWLRPALLFLAGCNGPGEAQAPELPIISTRMAHGNPAGAGRPAQDRAVRIGAPPRELPDWLQERVRIDDEAAWRRLEALWGALDQHAGSADQALRVRAAVLMGLRRRAQEIAARIGRPILDDSGWLIEPARALWEVRRFVIAHTPLEGRVLAFKDLFGSEAGEAVYRADLPE